MFDARLRWPLCWSIHQVSNQGGCGSCWVCSFVIMASHLKMIISLFSCTLTQLQI